MIDLASLGDYVRFQLASLNVKNKHHTFEDICYQFARLAISPNFLPATGPVSAGGDQGRDSETFDSAIAAMPDVGTPLAFSDGRHAVLACSLEKGPKAKIERDVNSICKTGKKPDSIYFFSNQDIPVASRHKLQAWASEAHGVHLEILDVNALAEQLTRTELFWIAQRYLNISSEMYPRFAAGDDDKYSRQRQRWIVQKTSPATFSDFMEIKYGIRHATFSTKAKIDIPDWIDVLRRFSVKGMPGDIVRRSHYEICVAALRGQNDLTSHASIVTEYFSTIDALTDPQELGDAVVLLSYCSTAVICRQFAFDVSQLHVWTKALIGRIEDLLKKGPSVNSKCELLQYRAHAATLPFQDSTNPTIDWGSSFKWWDRLVQEIKHAPLFPIERFANQLTALVPAIGDDPRFTALTERIDELLDSRSRGFVAAEKCRDRAIAFIEAGRPLRAIRELHEAKIKWFAEETIRGTVLSMLLLSRLYVDIKLTWAAKYYALGACFLIHKHTGDKLKRLLPKALIQLANVCYVSGEWFCFIELLPIVGAAQYNFRSSPDDFERYEDFQSVIMHALVLKAVGERFEKDDAKAYLTATLESWPLPDQLNELILDPPADALNWIMKWDKELVWERIDADLNGQPFSDAGSERKYLWRALGIYWEISCENSIDTVLVVEGLVSCLQIVIADIADIDLNLLPTKVTIQATVSTITTFKIKELASNDAAKWEICLPKQGSSEHVEEWANSLAGAIVISYSLLAEKEVLNIFDTAFKRGLASKTFSVRPYHELLREFSSKDRESMRRNCSKLDAPLPDTCVREDDALAWRSGPGPGYSKAQSLEFISNRYRRAPVPIRHTLARLRESEPFQGIVKSLREQGYLDWHILLLVANAVVNHRLPPPASTTRVAFEASQKAASEFLQIEESPDAPDFPESAITREPLDMQLGVLHATVAKTWGLNLKSRTPNFEALKKVLVERYAYLTDDVLHERLFD